MKKNFTVHTTEDVPGLGMVGGFKVAGAACDIRNKNDLKRLDVALIVSETPATGAGVFTTNDVKAAPVLTDMAHLSRSEKIKAIVANSGNANACNGERGMADAMAMCKAVAELVGSKPEQVLVCSTGRIGEFLPMQKIEKGVKDAFEKLSDSDSLRVSKILHAIGDFERLGDHAVNIAEWVMFSITGRHCEAETAGR